MGAREARLRKLAWIVQAALEKFAADDGWWLASHISLSLLRSLFPFLIFVAALAGFLGSEDLAKEATRLVFADWPPAVAQLIAEEASTVLGQRHGGHEPFGKPSGNGRFLRV